MAFSVNHKTLTISAKHKTSIFRNRSDVKLYHLYPRKTVLQIQQKENNQQGNITMLKSANTEYVLWRIILTKRTSPSKERKRDFHSPERTKITCKSLYLATLTERFQKLTERFSHKSERFSRQCVSFTHIPFGKTPHFE